MIKLLKRLFSFTKRKPVDAATLNNYRRSHTLKYEDLCK